MEPSLNSTSIAYEASRIVKPTPGTLYGLTGYNSKASAQFILIFDAPLLPAEGAVPAIIIAVAATTPFSLDYGSLGRQFKRGIVICNSSTANTKTIGSADCWFDVQYR